MRTENYLGLLLTPCVQALLLLDASSTPQAATAKPFALLAFLIPFACYLWSLRDAPILPRHSRRAALTLVALGLSAAGFFIGLMLITAHLAGY